ncbi:hypothetical protein KCU87_g34, partial [Aureobasidium melanogenum]
MFPTNDLAQEEFSEVFEAPDTSSSSTSTRKRRRREDTSFQCPQCHRVFGRIEHLRRHANSHGEARSFRCATCNKGFNRLDTLQRHELIHQKDPGVSKLKGARACKECASSKVRCNGTMPCEKCSSKNVDCVYPNAASPAQALDSPSSAVSDYASTPGASENVLSSVLESAAFPRQLGQSLPYIGHTNTDPEQHTTGVAESWNYNLHPEMASQTTRLVTGSLPAFAQDLLLHDAGAQQVALSPFQGSYSGTEGSFDIPYGSPFPRDRHASLDQVSRRPRLMPSLRSRTAILDSDSPRQTFEDRSTDLSPQRPAT